MRGLFDEEPEGPELERAFREFHAENPHIYRLFQRFAREARRGCEHYSARAIFHRIRWHVYVETNSDDDFKINNNHSPYYARMLMEDFPGEFENFFETRKVQT